MSHHFTFSDAESIQLDPQLPSMPSFVSGIRRAPDRGCRLTAEQTRIALINALRYIPVEHHEKMVTEFLEELMIRGRIYGYRFRPKGAIVAKAVDQYPGKCLAGKALQLMIDNNLDFDVALYPYELVTYGETGSVCQNWMQYRLIQKYLRELTEEQTLVVSSGHPLGLFRSKPDSPRVILTNGLMVGLYDNPTDWEIAAQMGVSNYGQMTAGGWMYIGPQGVVHGTYNTLLNAGRKKCGVTAEGNLKGLVFVSSGLGGMSGAQPKAAEMAGAVSVVAEVDASRIDTCKRQGWVQRVSADLKQIFTWVEEARKDKKPLSIAYYGNVVDLLSYIVDNDIFIDLLSDQTSCHVAYDGGYCPCGLTFDQRTELLTSDRAKFVRLVDRSLTYHFHLIKTLVARGVYFFDYGNSFMKAVLDAGVTEIAKNGRDFKDGFIFPSYFEDIMGPIFDYGYGPFRWVCLSGKDEDLQKTDQAAQDCIDPHRRSQDRDNYLWIRAAGRNQLVVGTKARILYQDSRGRITIALKFNRMVREKEIGPVMIGRDHHDPGGTDSPLRETANIFDGSRVTADMAVLGFAGNCARGMTLAALHNGGGVGIGKSINGGFGLLLDGKSRTDDIIQSALNWDVMGGIARRSWAGNANAVTVAKHYNTRNPYGDHITIAFNANENVVNDVVADYFKNDAGNKYRPYGARTNLDHS